MSDVKSLVERLERAETENARLRDSLFKVSAKAAQLQLDPVLKKLSDETQSYEDLKAERDALAAENTSLTDQLADADRVNELVKARHAELAEKLAALEKEHEAVVLRQIDQALELPLYNTCKELEKENGELRDELWLLKKEIDGAPVAYGNMYRNAFIYVCEHQIITGLLATHRARLVRIQPISQESSQTRYSENGINDKEGD